MSNLSNKQNNNTRKYQNPVPTNVAEIRSTQNLSITTNNNPLPSADDTMRYEQLHPGFADRLFKMAEEEQRRRNERDDKIVDAHVYSRKSDTTTIRTAQWMIFTIIIAFMSLLTLGIVYGYGDKIVIPSTTAIIVAGIYALIGKKKNTEDEDKQK